MYCNNWCGASGCTTSILNSGDGGIETNDLSCKSLEECEEMNEWCQSGRWWAIFVPIFLLCSCLHWWYETSDSPCLPTSEDKEISMTELEPKTVEEGKEVDG